MCQTGWCYKEQGHLPPDGLRNKRPRETGFYGQSSMTVVVQHADQPLTTAVLRLKTKQNHLLPLSFLSC